MFVSVFSAELDSSSDTCTASVHSAVLGFVVVAPVVAHDMCRMVQTMQNCLEVPQVQFLRVCGRRCVHAATSSRQSGTGFSSAHRQDRDGLKWAFSPHFGGIFFALRPAGREGQGGGDAGSLDSLVFCLPFAALLH